MIHLGPSFVTGWFRFLWLASQSFLIGWNINSMKVINTKRDWMWVISYIIGITLSQDSLIENSIVFRHVCRPDLTEFNLLKDDSEINSNFKRSIKSSWWNLLQMDLNIKWWNLCSCLLRTYCKVRHALQWLTESESKYDSDSVTLVISWSFRSLSLSWASL